MSKQPFAFISYRRSDAAQAIQGLFFQLRIRLGPSRIFMDVGAISVGDVWPDRLRRALGQATVVVAVIGPSWLTAADRYGRRRLDQADDWVRAEITSALSVGTPILPVLVGGASEMPPAEGLPSDLCGILQHQCLRLRDERWDDDMNQLVATLVKKHGFVEADRSVVLPQPEVRLKPLTEEELDGALSNLPGWEPVESVIPGDYPNSRYELRRAYRFKSFRSAIQFMEAAVDPINKVQHHPRWENQWRTVTVYLSTWDIGNKISKLDVELAQTLDTLYVRHRGTQGPASKSLS